MKGASACAHRLGDRRPRSACRSARRPNPRAPARRCRRRSWPCPPRPRARERAAACCGSTAWCSRVMIRPPSLVVVEVGVELGDEGEAARLVDLLVQGAGHAEQRHAEHLGGVAHRVRHLLLARRHAVERAVRLDVVERHALGLEEALAARRSGRSADRRARRAGSSSRAGRSPAGRAARGARRP